MTQEEKQLMDTNGHTPLYEDYVSFEIAKPLKEKGFDSDKVGTLGGFYSERCYESGHGIITQSGQEVGIVYDDLTNSDLEYDEYLRPTLQMAMKWLREKELVICVIPLTFYCGEKVSSWGYNIWAGDNLEIDEENTPEFTTYEEACEAAIKYCLENLI